MPPAEQQQPLVSEVAERGDAQAAGEGARAGHGEEQAVAAGADVEDLVGDDGEEGVVGHGKGEDDQGDDGDGEDAGTLGDVVDALHELGAGAAPAHASTLGLAEHDGGGEDDDEDGDGRAVGHADVFVIGPDEEAGHAGAEDPGDVHGDVGEGHGVQESLGRDQAGNEGVAGGLVEGHGAAHDRAQDVNVPHDDGIGDDEGEDDQIADEGDGLGDQEDPFLVEAVGHDAGGQGEEDLGQGADEVGEAQLQRATRSASRRASCGRCSPSTWRRTSRACRSKQGGSRRSGGRRRRFGGPLRRRAEGRTRRGALRRASRTVAFQGPPPTPPNAAVGGSGRGRGAPRRPGAPHTG